MASDIVPFCSAGYAVSVFGEIVEVGAGMWRRSVHLGLRVLVGMVISRKVLVVVYCKRGQADSWA